jgi:hypothetical protein
MRSRASSERISPIAFGLSVVNWQGKPGQVFEWALFPLGGETITHCLSLDNLSVISPRSRLLPFG